MGGLSRFPGLGSLCWYSGGWSWISSLWSAMKCPVMSYEMSMGLVCLWEANMHIEAQGYVLVLLENVCGMSFSATCWPLGGAWF